MPAKAPALALLKLDTPGGIQLGEPRTVGALTLVPLFHKGAAVEYDTYAEALGAGTVAITEMSDGGAVPTLHVSNSGRLPVLLVEGEILVGLMQNRVLNTTVLVAPGIQLEIPVACVEHGRWHHESAVARRGLVNLAPSLRMANTQSVTRSVRTTGLFDTDQGEVWANVADHLDSANVHSTTQSYDDLAQKRASQLRRFLAELRPAPGQVGVLAIIDDNPACLDLFDRATTLAALWEGLIGSYSIDALLAGTKKSSLPLQLARTWLEASRSLDVTEHPGVGLGMTVQMTSKDLVASALVVDGVVVHLAAFKPERGQPPASRFTPPRTRRAMRTK